MKTVIEIVRGTRATIYEVELPFVPEGALIRTPEGSFRVAVSAIDISPGDGPVQKLVVR